MLLELRPAALVQSDLWQQPDSDKAWRLMAVIDQLNHGYGYGRDTLGYASGGLKKAWRLRSDQRSPSYTTRWDELLVA